MFKLQNVSLFFFFGPQMCLFQGVDLDVQKEPKKKKKGKERLWDFGSVHKLRIRP